MKPENELAMVVALYLSKFGEEGLTQLGYRSYRQAFIEVGLSLNVKPNSIKNWRDEFDPYYDNKRKGWYQRGIRPTRQKVMTTFDNLSEKAFRAIVLDIITPEARPQIESELHSILKEIKRVDGRKPGAEIKFVSRGPTGRMAEEFFVSQFHAGLTPFAGTLKDLRDEGVGFDFEIVRPKNRTLVEIKGLAEESGSVTFTDKEWKVASQTQNDYFLGLVTQARVSPKIGFFQNPANVFTPLYHAYSTVAVSWTVNSEQLSRASSYG